MEIETAGKNGADLAVRADYRRRHDDLFGLLAFAAGNRSGYLWLESCNGTGKKRLVAEKLPAFMPRTERFGYQTSVGSNNEQVGIEVFLHPGPAPQKYLRRIAGTECIERKCHGIGRQDLLNSQQGIVYLVRYVVTSGKLLVGNGSADPMFEIMEGEQRRGKEKQCYQPRYRQRHFGL
jgi:hypothetical protein